MYSDYSSHDPYFKCNEKGCTFLTCLSCFSTHSLHHEHRLFTAFYTVEVPPDVANPHPVTPTAAQKTTRVASSKAAQGKSSGVSKLAASTINAGLLVGVESAISATTGLNIRLPRLDYVGLVRKATRTGKKARASTGAISEFTAVPGVAHSRTLSAGNVAHSKTSRPAAAQPSFTSIPIVDQTSIMGSSSSVLQPLANPSPFVMDVPSSDNIASILYANQSRNAPHAGDPSVPQLYMVNHPLGTSFTAEFSNLNSQRPSSGNTPSPISSPNLPPNNNVSGIRRKPVQNSQ